MGRGLPGGICHKRQRSLFQSTRPRGARLARKWLERAGVLFQSTRPAGARREAFAQMRAHGIVSIHAPARVGRDTGGSRTRAARCFNPRARVGRDSVHVGRAAARVDVSIHAPAWGATGMQCARSCALHAFQSTRPRGARLQRVHVSRTAQRSFNPRARGGATPTTAASLAPTVFQSTRPRGARPTTPTHERLSGRFNPRARAGRDISAAVAITARSMFQSTRPRGARRICCDGL